MAHHYIHTTKKNIWCAGFQLLELLLAIAILAVIAAVVSGVYVGFGKVTRVEFVHDVLVTDIKTQQTKAQNSRQDILYGIEIVSTNTGGYYDVFSLATSGVKEVEKRETLSENVRFVNIASGASTTLLFSKRGILQSGTVVVSDGQNYATTTLTQSGIIE